MTPLTLRSAVEAVASEIKTLTQAAPRGVVLGRVVAEQLRAGGQLGTRRVVRDFEHILQQLIAGGRGVVPAVAEAALITLRHEHGQFSATISASSDGAITPRQCRDARGLLGVTQAELAKRLDATQNAISLFERTGRLERARDARIDRSVALRNWFEQAGVDFADGGVKLRKPGRDCDN